MPLRIIVVRTGDSLKERLEPMLEACRETFQFEGPHWQEWSTPLETLLEGAEDPSFWILEVPRQDQQRVTFDELIGELDERPRSWACVLSPQERFNSEEAARMWLRHRCVVNYDLVRHLNLPELRGLIGELLERLPPSADIKNFDVGQWLEMPAEEYEAQKFVSLFLGGMRPVLWEIKRFLRALEEGFPERFKNPFENHPFLQAKRGTDPQIRSPQELFDEIMGPPNGKAKGRIPDWMRELEEQAKLKLKLTLPHLLILGETGTGKTLLAWFLHRYRFQYFGGMERELNALSEGERHLIGLTFQEINCGAIPENLVAGELFGAKAGAWTDLRVNLPGKIFCACLGTLVLDEIGSLPKDAQATFLRYLDDYTYTPMGWMGERFYVPAVVIAATNQPLERWVEEGKFRQDLYERFRFRIRLPSLKERMDHFEELVDFVLQNPQINRPLEGDKGGGKPRRRVNRISEEALQRLKQHSWPGNFRELEGVLWRAVDAAWAV